MNCELSCESRCARYGSDMRRFFTKAERIQMLKEYKQTLDNESQGITERISELEDDE